MRITNVIHWRFQCSNPSFGFVAWHISANVAVASTVASPWSKTTNLFLISLVSINSVLDVLADSSALQSICSLAAMEDKTETATLLPLA
jgi:hypothetical protein